MLFRFGLKKNVNGAQYIHIVSQVGFTIVGCILFCAFVGCWLGYHLELEVFPLLVFTILGIVGSIGVCIKQLLFITTLDSNIRVSKKKDGEGNVS